MKTSEFKGEGAGFRLKHGSYLAIVDHLKTRGYAMVQYLPSRFVVPAGQEISVFVSFAFHTGPCIFDSSILMIVYRLIFRLSHLRLYRLFKIFFLGTEFNKDDLTNDFLSEKGFRALLAEGFFKKIGMRYLSAYRFIPLWKMILVGKFREDAKDYVHIGYDTMILHRNIRNRLATAGGMERALEIGCGNGFLSLCVAKTAKRVDAVDINPEAVRLARINAELNNAGNINVFESDLYDRVEGRYDYILSNPPFELLPEEKADMIHGFGGHFGLEVTTRILEGLDERLSESGKADMLSSTYITDSGENMLVRIIKRIFSEKKFDITLKELYYRIRPEYYRYYRAKGIAYSITYFITVHRSDSYRLNIIPLSFLCGIRERIRLLILTMMSLLNSRC